jgi:PAS domain S-box-containing protein
MDLNQHIMNSSQIIHFIKDEDGCYKNINSAYEHICGFSREQIIGRTDKEVFPPNLYNTWKDQEARIMKEGVPDKFEITLCHEKTERSFLVFFMPSQEDSSGKKEYIGWSLEITERKKNEVNLQTILDSLNTGFLLIQPETRLIHNLNRRAEEMLGLPAVDIIGSDCQQYLCPFQGESCPILDGCMKVENRDGLLTNHKGEKVPILKTIIPVRLGGQQFLLESFTDVSLQKKNELCLKQNIEELEKFNKLTINREERMIELKQEINQLCQELGRKQRYKINL